MYIFLVYERNNNNNNNNKQSLRRKRPSLKYVVFRAVLHKNKKY